MSLCEFNKSELEELQTFLNAAFSPRVKKFLESAIHQIETNLRTMKPVESHQKSDLAAKPIKSYAWSQNDKQIELYINVDHPYKEEDINVNLTANSLALTLKLEGLYHVLTIKKLFDSVIQNKYKINVKTNKIVLIIYKSNEKHWECLSAADAKAKPKTPKLDEKEDPGASMMNMMKKLYDEGDDEMKRTISKAWAESQDKIGRGETAMPSMGG